MKKVVILSDTHAKSWEDMPNVLKAEIAAADAVIHAGDIGTEKFYSSLATECRKLYAVLGNNDDLPVLRELEFDLYGVKTAVVHGDKLPAFGSETALLYKFAGAELIICGHTHVPFMLETGTQTILNPGSVKRNRGVYYNSFAVMDIKNGCFDIEFIKLAKK